MFVKNCWYVVSWDHEIPSGQLVARRVVDDVLVLFRKADGSIVALEDRCVHRMAPLSLGRLEGDDVRCLYHGLRFAADGRCNEIPGLDQPIPERTCVRSYPVVERESWVWVWLGDPAAADVALIPPAVGLRHPRYVVKGGQLDYSATSHLINDNLTDLSHLSFVHAKSFGADLKWVTTRANVQALDRGIRVSRWIRNSPPIPPLGEAAKHERVDIWSTYDFLVPGVFLMLTALYPDGTADALDGAAPPDELPSLHSNFTSQAVTPTSRSTSRYFFSWGPRRDHGDEAMAELMLGIALQAFHEDKLIIEAQQQVIDLDPARAPVPVPADRGPMLFQRIVQRLATAEAAAAN